MHERGLLEIYNLAGMMLYLGTPVVFLALVLNSYVGGPKSTHH